MGIERGAPKDERNVTLPKVASQYKKIIRKVRRGVQSSGLLERGVLMKGGPAFG